MKDNIQNVILKDLCVSCGTCYSACPLGAITLIETDVFMPSIDTEKCDSCGLCEFACPGYHVDYKFFAPKINKKEKYNPLIGKYTNVYLGHAKNHYVRFMGSSGGVITAVLRCCLENGIIDGALVVTTTGLSPKIIVAKSLAELEQAMGSKYIPVPLNVGVRRILDTDGRFAIVGLPCHLLGLSRITLLYPILAKKIALKLGLFCGRGFDYHYLSYILKDIGVYPTKVRKIRFRGYGWPGKVFINYISKGESKEVCIDYAKFGKYSGSYLFMPKRCIFCPDHTAELADISFGDAWLNEIKKLDSQGTSMIISRTARGDKILSEAVRTGFIDVSESSVGAVIRSQGLQLNFHKLSFATRLRLSRVLGMKTPLVNVEAINEKSVFTVLFSASLVITQITYRILKKFGVSEFVPKPIVRLLGIFHSLLNHILARTI